ncbi:uncharacterized protein LOC118422420 [Branchiostoma floridae]|uniref:Uncharacterized protein LOC118422420 n=1 Tax=Branchiostoma floridae TaxID=7739 RepID=A0A9J7MY64_BRAFL|nr:uncharacterized protein LOC118422420 [Branchiostoma floridae]
MLLFAVTAVAAVTMTAHFNTDVEATSTNLPEDPPYRSWGDNRADEPDGLSGQSGWESVRVKRDFAVDDSQHYGVPDSMTSTDAPPLLDAPTMLDPESTTRPTGDMKNAKVPDQTETLKSEGWKSFRVEEFSTGDVDSHTQVQTVRPQLSDEEWDGYEGWSFTAEDTSNGSTGTVRVRRRASKIPDDSSPETNDSPAPNMTQLELKPNTSLERKASGDIDNTGTTAMENVRMMNTTNLNLCVLTDRMKSRERKHLSHETYQEGPSYRAGRGWCPDSGSTRS